MPGDSRRISTPLSSHSPYLGKIKLKCPKVGTSLQKESFIPGLLKPTYGVLVIDFQCTFKNLFPKYAVEEVCVYIVSFIPDFSYNESLQ